MRKIDVDSVFSATSMMYLKINKHGHVDGHFEQKNKLLKEGVAFITDYISKNNKYFNSTFSLLYNGYTERKFGEHFTNDDKHGFKNLYADSGGLQVLAKGIELDDSLKSKIYQSQDISDVSFCFDEIPVELKNPNAGFSKQTRTTISEKQFNYENFKRCAFNTAMNVKSQVNQLKHSKVCYIIQGNTIDDMVEWFDIAAEVLGDDIEKLNGIAPAGTCMGNGQLESCDMMCAAKIIFEKYPRLKKHIHFLGVGSSTRFFPTVLMMKNGFIPDGTTLSYDSSSFTMSYVMASFKQEDGRSVTDDSDIQEGFRQYLRFMSPVFEKEVDEYNIEEISKLMMENNRLATMLEAVTVDKSHKYNKIGAAIVPLYCVWCNYTFFNQLSDYLDNKNDALKYVYLLNDVTTVDGYKEWRSKYSHKVQSNRMSRKVEYPSINHLFG